MDKTERYFYGKADKLKSRKTIELLFKTGQSFSNYPFKVIWLAGQASETLQTGVGVSSRNFKNATDRNRVKRLIREAYRLQKNNLFQHLKNEEKGLYVFIIYTGKELPAYEMVFEKIGIILKRLIKCNDEKNRVLL